MFTDDWLKKIQDKYSTNDDIHINNYTNLLNHFRATDDDTPKSMTAQLLKRLLTGTSVNDISRILGLAERYNDLLGLLNVYDDEASQLKKEASNPLLTEEEKNDLHTKWQIAWGKREAYWTSIQIAAIPLTQICFDIENHKYMWCVDVDRIF